MVRNDFVIDFKSLLRKEGKNIKDVAEEVGTAPSAVSTRASRSVMNKGYVEIVEALGYDIEVRYVKRDNE